MFQGCLEGGTEELQERTQILISGEYADDVEAYMAQDQSGRIKDARAIGLILGLATGMGDVGTGWQQSQKKADESMARIENQRRELAARIDRAEAGMRVASTGMGELAGYMADTYENSNLVTRQARENADRILVQREELEAGLTPEDIAQREELRQQGVEVPTIEEAITQRDLEQQAQEAETLARTAEEAELSDV